jgi:hypothetical protein
MKDCQCSLKLGHRNGSVVIMMILVLGGLSIALLMLAGKTHLQMKSIRDASFERLQCDELLALGERVLLSRLELRPELSEERIEVDLGSTNATLANTKSYVGIIDLVKVTTRENEIETDQRWTIRASAGPGNGLQSHASKTVRIVIPQEKETRP